MNSNNKNIQNSIIKKFTEIADYNSSNILSQSAECKINFGENSSNKESIINISTEDVNIIKKDDNRSNDCRYNNIFEVSEVECRIIDLYSKSYTPDKGKVVVIRHLRKDNALNNLSENEKVLIKVLAEKKFEEVKDKVDYIKLIFVPILLSLIQNPKIKILYMEDYYNTDKKPYEMDIYAIRDTFSSLMKDTSLTRVFILFEDQIKENQEEELTYQKEKENELEVIKKLIDSEPKEILSHLENLFEKTAENCKLLGDFLDEVNDHEGAICQYINWAIKEPKNAKAYNNIGFGYLIYLKKPKEAYPYLLQAIELDPKHYRARNNLGCACFQMGNYIEALFYYIESYSLNSENPRNLYNIAEVLNVYFEEYELSIKYFKKSIEFFKQEKENGRYNQRLSKAYRQIGAIYETKFNDKVKALECSENAVKFDC